MDTSFSVSSIPTVSGTVALILALYYLGKLFLDWWRGRAADRLTTPATKIEVSNALIDQLQESLADERTANAKLREDIREQRRQYEKELDALRKQLADVSHRLEALQARLREPEP